MFAQAHTAETAIKRIATEFSSDAHDAFTPFALCTEIVSRVPSLAGNILVVSNLEFLFALAEHNVDCDNIYFTTPCTKKAKAATYWLSSDNIFVQSGVPTTETINMKFDVIIGNPPYQDSTGSSTSNSSLWTKISLSCFQLLKDDGYIAFITPQSWMKPRHKMFKWFKEHQLVCVSTEIAHHFPSVASTFSYWIARNSTSFVSTAVNGSNVDVRKVPYLVAGDTNFSIHQKLVFNTTDKFKIDSDQQTAYTLKLTKKSPDLSKVESDHCCYPIFHTNAQTIYSALKTKNFDDKKVMFSDSGYFRPRYNTGGLGSSQRCYYILVDNDQDGQNLSDILSLKVYQYIVKTAKWSGFSDLTVLRSLPTIAIDRQWTDEELYSHFNLTTEEIALIEATIR